MMGYDARRKERDEQLLDLTTLCVYQLHIFNKKKKKRTLSLKRRGKKTLQSGDKIRHKDHEATKEGYVYTYIYVQYFLTANIIHEQRKIVSKFSRYFSISTNSTIKILISRFAKGK